MWKRWETCGEYRLWVTKLVYVYFNILEKLTLALSQRCHWVIIIFISFIFSATKYRVKSNSFNVNVFVCRQISNCMKLLELLNMKITWSKETWLQKVENPLILSNFTFTRQQLAWSVSYKLITHVLLRILYN